VRGDRRQRRGDRRARRRDPHDVGLGDVGIVEQDRDDGWVRIAHQKRELVAAVRARE